MFCPFDFVIVEVIIDVAELIIVVDNIIILFVDFFIINDCGIVVNVIDTSKEDDVNIR